MAVVSTISTQPPMVADELRRQAMNSSISTQLIARIGRDPGDRPPRPVDHRRPVRAAPAARRGSPRIGPRSPRGFRRRPVARLPGLSTARSLPGREPGCVSRLVECAGADLWRRGRARGHCRPRAGIARRQPDWPPFHRRLRGRPSSIRRLIEFGFASGVYDRRPDDGLALVDCAIINRRALRSAAE